MDWQDYATTCACGSKLFRLDTDESQYRTCISCGQQLLDFEPEAMTNGY